ncbi:hypothetical protein NTE_02106 [Candidatus Nitrososphaera evergladensis SR1]|uniref:Uncharacterized protein n=1 Tax=Candidatus Nitrososphaera evergladensis SR1 TaxID=1459636 RepID=A0A075MRJ2_9ARCH|nr:hypothetical protein [Candidatus Nitrososphaera evergladensis]AIF84161.1 hypothetical protein NTE_02106 [Candidatus Nitrososphaera evergladensis SR1]
MASTDTESLEVAVVGKLVPNEGRYLISISKDYAEALARITTKRVLIRVTPLV